MRTRLCLMFVALPLFSQLVACSSIETTATTGASTSAGVGGAGSSASASVTSGIGELAMQFFLDHPSP